MPRKVELLPFGAFLFRENFYKRVIKAGRLMHIIIIYHTLIYRRFEKQWYHNKHNRSSSKYVAFVYSENPYPF